MVMLHSHSDHLPMTFDEISMERSKNFVKALQELKNLRPQLYSAAEYCEKSYLNSEQKQMVLYNLKDYALQALVTAVDHLGTVAYKLNDLFEQQTLDISTMELNISHLNEKLLTCQIYTEKEGLRQQQFLTTIPRHHKHYILPNSVNKKVQFSPQIQTDARQQSTYSRPRANPSGTNAAQTLSWHLASETISTLNATNHALIRPDDSKASGTTSGAFHLLDSKEVASSKSSPSHLLSASRSPAFSPSRKTFGVKLKESIEASRPSTPFRSFDKMNHHETVRAPSRSKSILSAFFPKQKTAKPISIYTK